jgi:hypothetical protein
MLNPVPDPYQMNTDPESWIKSIPSLCASWQFSKSFSALVMKNQIEMKYACLETKGDHTCLDAV